MERDDRQAVATFFADTRLAANSVAVLGEQSAHHARVRRLRIGDVVRLTNGAGARAAGSIAAIRRDSVDVAINDVNAVLRPSEIHLRVPIADRDRMLWLAEKATELGVASWQSVRFKRSMSVSPRGEGPAFAEKIRARMVSALEQSEGSWLPDILPETRVENLSFSNAHLPIILDANGEPFGRAIAELVDGRCPVIVVGPEGGIEGEELSILQDAGCKRVRLAQNTLRFETAGIAAIAAIRAAQLGVED